MLLTSVGAITMRILKVRIGSYFPKDLIERYSCTDQAVVGAVSEMAANGVSTCKVDFAGSELRYPYEGSKTLMHVFDKFEDVDLIIELLGGMYEKLPAKKPKKAK